MNNIIVPDWPIAQKKYEVLMLQELFNQNDMQIRTVLEVGTWTGGTALLWAQMVSRHIGGWVVCCDQNFKWGKHYSIERGTGILREYDDQMYRHTPYYKYITEFQGNSHDPQFIYRVRDHVMKETNGAGVDFLFIDGDHSYEGAKADFINYMPFLKKGHFCALHDILDTPHHRQWGCRVDILWNEIKNQFESWEFIDNNSYKTCCGSTPDMYHIACPSKAMGIGVIRKPIQ